MRLAILEIQERYYDLLKEKEELEKENFMLKEELYNANRHIESLEDDIRYIKDGRF